MPDLQLILKPYHYAVFNVILTAPEQEGVFASDIKMVTQFEVRPSRAIRMSSPRTLTSISAFQTLSIPYYVRTAQGSLSVVPETVVIENSFPVSVCASSSSSQTVPGCNCRQGILGFRL